MELVSHVIPGVLVARLDVRRDDRGSFTETWREEWFPGMTQANRSHSRCRVLRGMHFHLRQSDLWRLESGSAIALLADLRGAPAEVPPVHTVRLYPDELLYIPPGVAHGYFAQMEDSVVAYMVTSTYDPTDELGVLWSEFRPEVPKSPMLSPRDAALPRWADLPADQRAALAAL